MKSAPILVFLVAGGLLGWFYQDLTAIASRNFGTQQKIIAAGTPLAESRQHQLDVLQQQKQQQHWLAGETVLQRQADGHFYAEVTAGVTSLRMMVDTGASVVALTGDDARAIGLHWDDSEIVLIGHGASGPVSGVNRQIERLQLGNIEAHGVHAVVIPEGLVTSLLGQSFLSQIRRVEIVDDEMVLGD